MEEKTFFEYEDVKVTSSQFMVGTQTITMRSIASVKVLKEGPERYWPIALITIGIMLFLGSAIVGVVIVGVGILWLVMQKTMFHVMLTTAEGESSAMSSHRRKHIDKIVQALNDAIVARG